MTVLNTASGSYAAIFGCVALPDLLTVSHHWQNAACDITCWHARCADANVSLHTASCHSLLTNALLQSHAWAVQSAWTEVRASAAPLCDRLRPRLMASICLSVSATWSSSLCTALACLPLV